MIQRIQSLYLFIIFGLMLTMLFVPFATFIGGTDEGALTAWGIKSLSDPGAEMIPSIYMAILIILATLLPLVNIFLYKWRMLQMRLCLVEIVLLLGVLGFLVMYILNIKGTIGAMDYNSIRYSVVDVIPVICIILSVMAFRAMARDRALIKSLDRIR